jgi:hypothetical protein
VLGHVNLSSPLTFTQSYDDLYVCDGSGGVEDTFLGDHRVVCVVASSGNGTHADWTPLTGGDHGAMVDENPPNLDTDYNMAGSVGNRDTYNFAALGVSGTIKCVQTVNLMLSEVGGLRYVADSIRIGGVDYDGTPSVLGGDWAYRLERHRVSPATSTPWSVGEIDGAEFGVKVTT